MVVPGVIVEGYRVASGPSKDYPYGSLEKQIPLFKQRGLNLERFYAGTLNVSIAPASFEMVNPEFTFIFIYYCKSRTCIRGKLSLKFRPHREPENQLIIYYESLLVKIHAG